MTLIPPRRRRLAVPLSLAITGLLASCGSSSKTAANTTTAAATTAAGGAATTAAAASTAAPATTAGTTSAATTGAAGTTTAGTTGTKPTSACTTTGQGGKVTIGVYSFTQSLDPTVAGANGLLGSSEMAAIYDTLMVFDPATGAFKPRVAKDLQPNSDFTQWTLTLRDGVKFGNGDPLTADAVKTSIGRHLAATSKSTAKSLLTIISDMTVVDPLTLKFTLSSPWPKFPYVMTLAPGMITDQKVVDAQGANFVSNPVGAGVGPFELQRFAAKETVVLKPKSDYWGGIVCPSELDFNNVPTGQGAYEAMKNGEIDVMVNRDSRAIAQAKADGIKGIDYTVSSGWLFALNSGTKGTTPPTADVRIRKAIAEAIDVNAINQRAEDGKGNPTDLAMAPGSLLYQKLPGPDYNLDDAKKLVQTVIAEGKWDGTIRLQCSPDPLQSEQALAAQAMLGAAGFKVQLTTTATIADMVTNVVSKGDYDISCWGFNVFDTNAWGGLKGLTSAEASNYYGYKDPNMDSALAELRLAPNVDAEKTALKKVQAAWTDTVPMIVLGAADNFVGYTKAISGLVGTSDTIVLYDQVRRAG